MRLLADFFWPATNPIAMTIIIALIILFIYWLIQLILSRNRIHEYKHEMLDCGQLNELSQERYEYLDADSDEEEESTEDEPVVIVIESDALQQFEILCKKNGIKDNGAVATHIKTIIKAGEEQSRLEVSSLIENTSNKIFAANSYLKAIMSLFIVIGLLGTLFGLANSLAQLLPAIDAMNSSQSSAIMTNSLNDLLFHLKGAFAPSIWGISFTVLSIFIFSRYLRFTCMDTKNLLDRLTIMNWVPLLYPTTTQRMQEALLKSEKQMNRSFSAAQKVAEFAEDIEDQAKDFQEGLKKAVKDVKRFSSQARRFEEFSDKFFTSVENLTSFQQDLNQLYQQMVNQAGAFQAEVSSSLAGIEGFSNDLHNIIKKQNENLVTVVQSLQLYEKSYIEQRDALNQETKEALEATKTAYVNIVERNQELIDNIGKPLEGALLKGLYGIEKEMSTRLQGINDQFIQFDVPISSAADKIGNTVETLIKQTEVLYLGLQNEFINTRNDQNERYEQRFIELIKIIKDNNKELVASINSMNISIHQTDKGQNIQELGPKKRGILARIKEGLGRER